MQRHLLGVWNVLKSLQVCQSAVSLPRERALHSVFPMAEQRNCQWKKKISPTETVWWQSTAKGKLNSRVKKTPISLSIRNYYSSFKQASCIFFYIVITYGLERLKKDWNADEINQPRWQICFVQLSLLHATYCISFYQLCHTEWVGSSWIGSFNLSSWNNGHAGYLMPSNA